MEGERKERRQEKDRKGNGKERTKQRRERKKAGDGRRKQGKGIEDKRNRNIKNDLHKNLETFKLGICQTSV